MLRVAVVVAVLCALVVAPEAGAASLPNGFHDALLVSGLADPTGMTRAPDGRIFVAEQAGAVRVIKQGKLLTTPFATVTVATGGERGLLGIAFDPKFASNHYVYLYYTASSPTIHNRVSRFVANGDVAAAGSEHVLFELPTQSANYHMGGAIRFGGDGKLYVSVGDNGQGSPAQSMTSLFGKVLRLNADGTIPTSNPFYSSATGTYRAIWALGLRNPFTLAFQPGTGRLHINDVGENTWEEIDVGSAGANYGWPVTEGPTSDPRFVSPFYAYAHGTSAGTGCAITGGAFYNPKTAQFPSSYVGDYFYADFCSGWIRRLDVATKGTYAFATGIAQPISVEVNSGGPLLYLTRGGAVRRITYG